MPPPTQRRGSDLARRTELADSAREFNPLLPSEWVPLPYPGDTGKIRVRYNLEKVMELPEVYRALMRDELAALAALDERRRAATAAWQAATEAYTARQIATNTQQTERLQAVREVLAKEMEPDAQWAAVRVLVLDEHSMGDAWPTKAEDEAAVAAATETYTTETEAMVREMEALQNTLSAKVVQYTVIEFDWPFRGRGPDPREPATWGSYGLSDHVIHWIADSGVKEAREQVKGPLFVVRSRAIT